MIDASRIDVKTLRTMANTIHERTESGSMSHILSAYLSIMCTMTSMLYDELQAALGDEPV